MLSTSLYSVDQDAELQESAILNYDFSFLPEKVAEYKGQILTSKELLRLLRPKLSKVSTSLVNQYALKKLVYKFLDSHYKRLINLELAINAGYLPNEGLATLKLEEMKKNIGEKSLYAQFEFTGLNFSQAAKYYAESMAMEDYFTKSVIPEIELNEADTLTYYMDHEKEFDVADSVKISQVFFGFLNDDSRLLAQQRAKKAMQLLSVGKTFEFVAQKYNFGGALKNKGVINRFFTHEQLRPALRGALKMKVGEVSAILESGQGFHIIQLLEKRAAGKLSFDSIKDPLLKKMSEKAAMSLLQKRIVTKLKEGGFKLFLK
jgi:parvulin-like peptidyl-prolyl isomerase